MGTRFWLGNVLKNSHLGEQEVDGRITLIWPYTF